jgi:N4-bis(aminopropyl)spermidine synthase
VPTSQNLISYLIALYARKDTVIGSLLRSLPLNPTTRQVLGLTYDEQLAYLQKLWGFNQKSQKLERGDTGSRYEGQKIAGFLRRFNQLPCTLATRRARADLLSGRDLESSRILILGDDDLLSVELSKRGFKQVAVADCDPVLLDRIRRETADCATSPRIILADFHRLDQLKEVADVVILDPPYSTEGATAFLNLAVSLAAPQATMYMMVNPHVLGAAYQELNAKAVQSGFRLTARREGFNAYPIGTIPSIIMRLAWWHYMRLPLRKTVGRELCFFSDCFEFVRG